ncbi:Na(+)/H(+) antiporter subunit C [Alkalihalobacillus trypoxylicola]|uniref:Cation:proton antiporter n=1 Tax=Alkalihalobacillus trypoxylicola TaxID=519424 RepID=A0A162E7X0_9BACI|nr:Na(+)/H(+) antiporter subunit C [Alkalihalobacillus trypoxylicola]KYG31992.1 cation:proton antiporter [Alkalihalobacillus trypoxylicola]GAF66003.1 multi subunit monovarent cation/proton antiporter MrpC subunit [Bacillus sp. TS-2]
MEIIISILSGILFTIGTYLILSKNMTKIIIGTAVLSHGVHMLLLTMGGLKLGAAPLLGYEEAAYTDPLPQALILTAIVISFGVTSFLLVLAYRTYKVHGTDDMEKLRGMIDDD